MPEILPPASLVNDSFVPNRASNALVILLILVILKAAYFSTGGSFGTDFLTHVEYAKYYIEHHELPQTDWLTWTSVGKPYLITQWLGQLLMGIPFIYGGYQLSAFITALTIGLIVIFAWRTAMIYINNHMTAMFIAIFSTQQVWSLTARPQVFGMLAFSILVWMISIWLDRKERWVLMAMPSLMLVWVNLHGTYSIGLIYIAVTGLAAFGVTYASNGNRFKNAIYQQLPFSTAATASFLATLINPYGWHAWEYIINISQLVTSNHGYIVEWSRTSFFTENGNPFFILISATFCAMILSPTRMATQSLLGFVAIFLFGMGADRQTYYAAFALTPFLAKSLQSSSIERLFDSKPIFNFSSRQAIIVLTIPCLLYWPIYQYSKSNADIAMSKAFPIRAVNYIIDNNIQGRIYNGINAGSYIESKGRKSFMDGRLDLFGDEMVLGWFHARDGRPSWKKYIDKYDPDIIIVEKLEGLRQLLMVNAVYHEVYDDEINSVFIRNSMPNSKIFN